MSKKTILVAFSLVIISMFFLSKEAISQVKSKEIEEAKKAAMGVCPPFNLLDEAGNVIDPLRDLNADKPYSPKRTCGKCHDYKKISQGYHFQMGKDETLSSKFKELYPWCKTPGQYGGRW